MPISLTLPIAGGTPASVKDMIFTILTTNYPLTLIELLNTLKRRYNVSVSFQSVRKAALQLTNAGVLAREEKRFSISKQWILEISKLTTDLQKQYFNEGQSVNKLAVGGNTAVYTFSRLVDSDVMWNTIMRESFASDPSQPKVITFSAVHFWWVLATLVQETELYKEMKLAGIDSHFLCYGRTPLDDWTVKFYNNIGVACERAKMPKNFTDNQIVGTYGDLILKATYPPELARKIDQFFRKHKRVEQTNLPELAEITTEKHHITLTVIKDPLLSASLREEILRRFV